MVRPAVWISVTLCAAYACSSGTTYAQETTPSATVAVDDKETKEVQPLVEPAAQEKPWFNLYGWIEAGITGNPNAPADNHNFGHVFTDRANEPLFGTAATLRISSSHSNEVIAAIVMPRKVEDHDFLAELADF